MFANADQLTSSKMIEVKKIIEGKNPLIVAVSEVKRKNSKERSMMDYEILGYSLHPVNLSTAIGRGGAVYSHESLDKPTIQILEVRFGGDTLLFGCCYRSPTSTETSDQNNAKLNQLLKHIPKRVYSHTCTAGDFNFENINWSSWTTPHSEDSVESTFIEPFRDCYFSPHVEQATRRRGNDDPSLLDLILTDEAMQVSDILHHSPLGKSDHSVSTFEFHCYLDCTKPKDKFAYANGDYVAGRNNLANSEWKREYMEEMSEETTVENLWFSLKSKLTDLRNLFFPKQLTSGEPSWKDKGSFPIDKRTRDAIKSKTKTYRVWMSQLRQSKKLFE